MDDDSNESTESNVIVGFRGFGSSSPGPSGHTNNSNQLKAGIWDANERARNAVAAVKCMCECYALEPHLLQLLGEK